MTTLEALKLTAYCYIPLPSCLMLSEGYEYKNLCQQSEYMRQTTMLQEK